MKYHPCPSQLLFAWTSPAQYTATLKILSCQYYIIMISSPPLLTCVSRRLVGLSQQRRHLLAAVVPHPLSCDWSKKIKNQPCPHAETRYGNLRFHVRRGDLLHVHQPARL